MFWKKFYRLLVLLPYLAAVSCSVKEDRSVCPCTLMLDMSCVDSQLVPEADLFVTSKGSIEYQDKLSFDKMGDEYVISVPRKKLHLSVWTASDCNLPSGGMEIPLGCDCPRMYMFDTDLDTFQDESEEVVEMHKNHCVMTVMTELGDRFVHDVRIVGNVSGYTCEGKPAGGKFEYLLNGNRYEDGWKVVLPRQVDASLSLLIDDGQGTVKSFSIGNYIVSSGYDWTTPDLEDITLSLDYALTEVTIRIEGWESEFTYKVEI